MLRRKYVRACMCKHSLNALRTGGFHQDQAMQVGSLCLRLLFLTVPHFVMVVDGSTLALTLHGPLWRDRVPRPALYCDIIDI